MSTRSTSSVIASAIAGTAGVVATSRRMSEGIAGWDGHGRRIAGYECWHAGHRVPRRRGDQGASVRRAGVLRGVRLDRRRSSGPTSSTPRRWNSSSRTRAAEFDVFVMYDMPGIEFTRADPPVAVRRRRRTGTPTRSVRCSRPARAWSSSTTPSPDGRRGRGTPTSSVGDSTTSRHACRCRVSRTPAIATTSTHTIEVLDPSHPICAGIGESFTITDEVYLFPVLEDEVQPLMRSTLRLRRHELLLGRPRDPRAAATIAAAGTIRPAAISSHGRRPSARLRSPTSSSATARPPTPTRTTAASSPTPSTGPPTSLR